MITLSWYYDNMLSNFFFLKTSHTEISLMSSMNRIFPFPKQLMPKNQGPKMDILEKKENLRILFF
jgi:hypothetical protein